MTAHRPKMRWAFRQCRTGPSYARPRHQENDVGIGGQAQRKRPHDNAPDQIANDRRNPQPVCDRAEPKGPPMPRTRVAMSSDASDMGRFLQHAADWSIPLEADTTAFTKVTLRHCSRLTNNQGARFAV